MNDELIYSYHDDWSENLTIEDFYEYCLNDNDDFSYSKEDFIKKFEQSNEFYEWASNEWYHMSQWMYEDCEYEANKILGSKSYVKVVGSMGLWNGTRYVDRIILETELTEIIDKYINTDTLIIEVYNDRVELCNIHHDGRNSYTFTPFSFSDLTKKELLEQVDKEEYEWYGDKLYKATKDDLVNHLEDIFLKGY